MAATIWPFSPTKAGRLLGKLGAKQRYDGLAYVCPECGLARLYADVKDA